MVDMQLLEVVRQCLLTGSLAVMPVLAVGFIVAVVVGLMQAATGVQEPLVGLVPRLVAMGFVLLVTLPWMVERLADLFRASATAGM
jgi:flagellar biosynthesis protein FliQ